MERIQIFAGGLFVGLGIGLFVGVIGLQMWFGS